MNSAILPDGIVITANEYNASKHGGQLYCLDQSCKVPVIFIPAGKSSISYFKTSGKLNSKHKPSCGFRKHLNFIESIMKVEEFQNCLTIKENKETIIKVNLNRLDPDYQKKVIQREENPTEGQKNTEVKIKQENKPPATVGSLKSMVKLLTSYEPDILSSIFVNIQGKRLPISSIVINQQKAHSMLWNEEVLENVGYFVFGHVESVQRREKVYYINFNQQENIKFSIIIFDKYFEHFNLKDDQLIGKNILVYGKLKKNEMKRTTHMVIKSEKFIEFLGND